MKNITGDIWDYLGGGHIVIPTNLCVKRNGMAVMGKGLAWQAANKFFDLPKVYGDHILSGNKCPMEYTHGVNSLFMLPTKEYWMDPSDIGLIENGLRYLSVQNLPQDIYLPMLGCGLGRLEEKQVLPLMMSYFGNRDDVVLVKPGR